MPDKDSKEITVFVDGVWDMMHYNHIEFMREARSLGTRLAVGVVSDASVESYKRRPILTEQERLRTVKALPFVDEAFIYDGPFTPELLESHIARVKADIVVYGSPGFDDYFKPAIDRGIFRRFTYREGLASTEIIRRIRERLERGDL